LVETTDSLKIVLEELWSHVGEAGRTPSDIDIASGTPATGSAASESFDPDAHPEYLEEIAQLMVTRVKVGIHDGSRAHALQTLDRFGETVVAPTQG
jgi:hypothetical protein